MTHQNTQTSRMRQRMAIAILGGSTLTLAACSSGNSKTPPPSQKVAPTGVREPTNPRVAPTAQWTPGAYEPASQFAGFCETPKTGTNPFTGRPYDHVQGTAMHEKLWIRSMSNDLYLWSHLLPDPDPRPFTPAKYFQELKTDFDRFHYTSPVEEYVSSSQAGVHLDYGVRWGWQHSPEPALRVADITDGYDLEAHLSRGETVVAVDGIVLAHNNTRTEVEKILAGLNPTEDDPHHVVTLRDADGNTKDLMLTARALEHSPVPRHRSFVYNDETFGYIQFDAHNAIAAKPLAEAVAELEAAETDELILDLRYNTGGAIAIASEISYMIAGAGVTAGQPFISPRYNDKHTEVDPWDGTAITPFPFLGQRYDPEDNQLYDLPSLNLSRVYILTSHQTCSASEAIINGLKGVGIEVVQIGNTTCGKPYTFRPVENCGTVYSTVLFSNENALGFGDYASGFSPTNGIETESASRLPGCEGDDDMDHPLGSLEERLLAKAIYWHEHGACPPEASGAFSAHSEKASQNPPPWSATGMQQPSWRNNAVWLPQ